MKNLLLTFLFLASGHSLYAENTECEKLKGIMDKHTLKDTNAVMYRFRYGCCVGENDNLKAISILEETLELAAKLEFKKGEAMVLNYLIMAYNIQGELNKATQAGLRALKIWEEINCPECEFKANINMAELYRLMLNFENAIVHYQKCIEIAGNTKNRSQLMDVYVSITTCYSDMQDWGNFEIFLEKAFVLSKELGNTGFGAIYYQLKAGRELAHNNFFLAKEYYLRNLSFKDQEKNYLTYSFNLSQISVMYAQLNQHDSAMYYLQRAFEVARTNHLNKELRDAYNAGFVIYYAAGDYKNALTHYLSYDSMLKKDYNMQAAKDVAVSKAKFEEEKAAALAQKELERQKLLRNAFILGFAAVFLFAVVVFVQRNKIKKARERSDELLMNILPAEVAEELKLKGSAEARHFDEVTVLFTDFKDFTQLSETMSAKELVDEIHTYFKAFDQIIEKHGIEKIKTIGDAYMCAGGLPVVNRTHAADVVSAGLDIQAFVHSRLEQRRAEGIPSFQIRIGIHTGAVVAGIVGIKKFAYDIWGDTVNTASRMESSGEVGKVNISGSTYELVKDKFTCTHRGKIDAKGKGKVDMYFVESL